MCRTHLLPQGEFRRIVETAEQRRGFDLLPTLDPSGSRELGKGEPECSPRRSDVERG